MTQQELELHLCKTNFKFFLGYCFKHITKSNFAFHNFHNELIEILLRANSEKRVIINAPPRIGKTEIVKHFIAWQFIKDPSATIVYVSYDQGLVSRKNSEIQDILKFLGRRFMMPELQFRSNNDGKTEWKNNAGGAIIARGSGNAITGGGCKTLMVIDDPNKPEDRTSPAKLEARNRIFANTIRNRIDLPEVPIIVIQQRVAAEDLTGFLKMKKTGEDWFHYSFPAINKNGEALCPERLPVSEIETYKSNPFIYNAQYMQEPLDVIGKLFKRETLVLGTELPKRTDMRLCISVDTSSKDKISSDYNCAAVIGYDGLNYHILEICNFKADITLLIKKCRDLRTKYPGAPLLFESQANGVAAAQILRKDMNGVLDAHSCKNKIDRACAVKYLFDGFNVMWYNVGLEWGAVQSQFLAFPHGRNDDMVDAVCQGIDWLSKLPAHTIIKTDNIAKTFARPAYNQCTLPGANFLRGR